MKRFAYIAMALIMIFSSTIPASAVELKDEVSSATAGRYLVQPCNAGCARILEEEPNAACGIASHRPPSGFRYIGSSSGNTQAEIAISSIGANLLSFIPGLGTLVFLISSGVILSDLEEILEDDIVRGRYYKYEWSNGTRSWYHIVWVTDYDNDGLDNYVTCAVESF